MEHLHISSAGDEKILKDYKKIFESKTLEELVEDYNKQAKLGITGVHRQALVLIALRKEFKERLGDSPIHFQEYILGMKGEIQIVDGQIKLLEKQLNVGPLSRSTANSKSERQITTSIESWKKVIKEENIDGLSQEMQNEIITKLFISDEINISTFQTNYRALSSSEASSVASFFGVEDKPQISPSLSYFVSHPGRTAPAFPLWFYAAYPDVMSWFHEFQKKFMRMHNYNQDALAIQTSIILGVNSQLDTLKEDQVYTRDRKYRPKLLRNLIDHYCKENNKGLDLSTRKPKSKLNTKAVKCDRCGEHVEFASENLDEVCPNCGWSRSAAVKFVKQRTSDIKKHFTKSILICTLWLVPLLAII